LFCSGRMGPQSRFGNDAIWLTAVKVLEYRLWNGAFGHARGAHTHKSSRRRAIYPGCMRRILLQFPGFGVIDVITRAIARKEMRTYDDLYDRFRRSQVSLREADQDLIG